jgi:hypothetical protein
MRIYRGDEEAQIAIRFSLVQLLIAAPRHDSRSTLAQNPPQALAIEATRSGIPDFHAAIFHLCAEYCPTC